MFYKQAEEFSPYYEQYGSCLNRWTKEDVIHFNSFYRFEDIFGALYSTEEVPEKIREHIFDILVHYLIYLDRRGEVERIGLFSGGAWQVCRGGGLRQRGDAAIPDA